ncbi:MAG: acyltransferase family protein [Dehalococcoidia bacterium]
MDSKRLPYLPGLDGMRAVAVIAVLLYHARPGWVPGGFLGVDVFFVISGYLITCILLAEWRQRGRINLGGFWLRRARRLLAAMFFLVVTVLAVAVILVPGEVASLRVDALAAAGYMTNWYLIFDHQPYFESFGRPSLLRHLWSLAVEEQYYIVWPLLIAGGLKLLRPRFTLAATLAGAAASAALMAALYHPDGDNSRIFYGTDTRATGLLIGSALAFVWVPGRLPALAGRARVWGLEAVGCFAIASLIVLHLWLNESRPFLYQGGFALVGVATALAIAVIVHPQARLGRLFGSAPLRWVGLRSYSIYLWQWPVIMLTRPHLDVPIDGLPLLAVRFGLTFALAEVSYRLVEMPIRGGALGRAWRSLMYGPLRRRRRMQRYYAGAFAAAVAPVLLLGVFVAHAERPAPPPQLAVDEVRTGLFSASPATPSIVLPPPTPTPAPPSPAATEPAPPSPATTEPAPPSPAITKPPPPAASAPIITSPVSAVGAIALGDSVMLGAAPQLTQAVSGVSIDATVSRQVSAGISMLLNWRTAGQLGDVMIVQLGNNGTFTAAQFDGMMGVLSDVRLVVFVNLKVPRSWEEPNNAVLASGVARYGNAVLVDWRGASAGRYELFWDDGIHLRPEGASLYAGLIASALAAHPAPTPSSTPTVTPTPPPPTPTATPPPPPPPTPTPPPPPPAPTATPSPGAQSRRIQPSANLVAIHLGDTDRRPT